MIAEPCLRLLCFPLPGATFPRGNPRKDSCPPSRAAAVEDPDNPSSLFVCLYLAQGRRCPVRLSRHHLSKSSDGRRWSFIGRPGPSADGKTWGSRLLEVSSRVESVTSWNGRFLPRRTRESPTKVETRGSESLPCRTVKWQIGSLSEVAQKFEVCSFVSFGQIRNSLGYK